MTGRVGLGYWAGASALTFVLILLVAAPLFSLGEIVLQQTDPVPASKSAGGLFRTTLGLSLSVTGFATVIGTLAGLGVFMLPGKVRNIFLFCALASFFVPTYVYALAWIELVGTRGWLTIAASTLHLPTPTVKNLFSLPGTIAVSSLTQYPLVMCAAYVACARIDVDKIDAARTEGSLWSVMRHVMIPHATPFIATAALVVYLLTLTSYTLPALFQISTYSIEIFTMYNAFHDPASGILQSLPLIALALAAIAAWWIIIGAGLSHTAFSRLEQRDLQTSFRVRLIVSIALAGLLCAGAGLPLAMIFIRAASLENLAAVWNSTRSEWFASLSLSAVTTLLIVLLSGIGTLLTERLNRPAALSIIVILTLPYLISGPAWGIALVSFWNHNGWRASIYDRSAIAVIACTGKYLFMGWIGFTYALRSIRPEYKDTARIFGMSQWHQFCSITAPLIAPYATLIAAVIFLQVLGEVDSLLLVSPPGFTTVPVRLYGLMHYGPSELVASLSILIVILIGVCGLAAFSAFKILERVFKPTV